MCLKDELLLAFARFESFVPPAYAQYLIAKDDPALFMAHYPYFEALAARWILPKGSPLYRAYVASRPFVRDHPAGFFVVEYMQHVARTQAVGLPPCDPYISFRVQ